MYVLTNKCEIMYIYVAYAHIYGYSSLHSNDIEYRILIYFFNCKNL